METSEKVLRVQFGLLPFLARLFLIAEFLIAVNGKVTGWSGQAAYMTAKGMHFIAPLLGAALVIEAAGSACLAIGFWTRPAARLNPSMWRGRVHHSVRELGVFVPYRMPIAGLYQTGGSTAPGGSVTGQPGRNAAITILQDDGKSLEQVLGKPLRGP